MKPRWKILLGLLGALAVLLALNTVALDNETKGAKLDVAGAQIVSVAGGDLQVKQDGPRGAPPIVLLHCFTCSIHWWDRITPLLARDHRVIRIDLLGHGGSEKPSSGYSMDNQARLVALVLGKLGIQGATVVGHSMGANVAVALAQQSSQLVDRLVIIDQGPASSFDKGSVLVDASVLPVLGELMKRTAPDFVIRDGLGSAFADGFHVPDQFVNGLKGMTYTAYRDSHNADNDYRKPSLDQRVADAAVPLLAIFGADDKLEKAKESIAAYKQGVPGAETALVQGAGHSPAVEKPAETARLILRFANEPGSAAAVQRAAAKAAAKRARARKQAQARRAKAKRRAAQPHRKRRGG